ncbi:MAG: pilus assembly protein PilM [Candidatus Omnitrophota bacterium]
MQFPYTKFLNFGEFFNKKNEDFVAINVGNYHVKGLIVKSGKPTDYFLKERKDISTTLKEIWQEKKITTDNVAISVKDPTTLTRYFPFPKIDKKKLRQSLFYELNKHIPFSPEEVYFDFALLGDASPTQSWLLLAVAKKEFINNILDIFTREKLNVTYISLDSICLVNFFLHYYDQHKKTNTCLLDVGSSFSTLTILRSGVPFLTRDISFSAKDVFGVISHIKNIPLPEIEKQLLLPNNQELLELAQDSLTNLCKEVKNSFDYFEVNKGEHIEQMYLSGGLTYLAGVEAIFKDYLGIETALLSNTQAAAAGFSDEAFQKLKRSFTVAFGLLV